MSLFGGGLGASKNPPTSSLFNTNNTSSAFGNTTSATTQPSQSSLFGQTQVNQQQQQPQPSILGQNQPQAKSSQAQEPMTTQATKPAFFNSLLERGKKRPFSGTAQNGNFEDVPTLHLGLDDIRRKARELGTSGTKDPQQIGTTKA